MARYFSKGAVSDGDIKGNQPVKDNKAKADAFRIRVLGIDAYDHDEHTLGFWEHVAKDIEAGRCDYDPETCVLSLTAPNGDQVSMKLTDAGFTRVA
jgi:hypothetical protein